MQNKKFNLAHLFLGAAGLLVLETVILRFLPMTGIREWFVVVASLIGAGMTIYVSIEAIEDVRNRTHLLVFLSLIVLEFIAFFAVQYRFMLFVGPGSFPALASSPLELLLHSTMVFIFNPLWLPATPAGQALLLVNTLSALGLALFILQNVWQLQGRQKESNAL